MSGDLISRAAFFPNGVFFVNESNPMTSLDELLNRIWNAPAVDAEPVIRCKDCRYWCDGYCDNPDGLDTGAMPDSYCSHGKRK